MSANLLYFAPVAFGSYAQRPHYMVRHLLERGVGKVVWVEPYATRLPRLGDLWLGKGDRPTGAAEERIEVLRVPALPIEPLPGGAAVNSRLLWGDIRRRLRELTESGKWIIGVGRPSGLAVWALDTLPHTVAFYDAMDDFPAFYDGLSARSMEWRGRQVAARAEVIFCSSHSLQSKLRQSGLSPEVILNGYDAAELPPPFSVGQRRYIGYVGTIGRWFDWALVLEMADALCDWPFRLIGPEFVGRPKALPPNVEMLPACPQRDAVEHVRRFSVGLIPFVRSRLTNSVDPIKYYEYRSLGLPVWSTDFGEMAVRGEPDGVFKIASGIVWRELLDRTSGLETAPGDLARFRASCDWSHRFDPVARLVLGQ